MLDELKVDSDGKVSGIMVHVGTYAENVYSTHILEYELYRAFCEFKGKNLDDPVVWSELRSKMSIRNHMHLNVGTPADKDFSGKMMDSLCKGYGRESLLSVQMLVLVKSRRTHKHELKIVERSHNVAIAPGIYQFIPAGGFEILNDSDDNVYEDEELISNFSPGGAVFREYLEEGFNAVEFEGRGSGSIQDRLLNDPRIIEIEDMLEKEEATLQFLGSVMDLAGMRQELSFVLVIDDEDYSRHRFIANDECKKGRILENITVENFESKEKIWEKIHGPSAAMWKLFKETKLYQRILREDAGN